MTASGVCPPACSPRRSSAQPPISHSTSAMMESTYSTSSLVGIGVVHAQVANAAEFARDAEIQADRLGMADVEVAIRFGRKARVDFRITLFRHMRRHDVADKIRRRRGWRGRGCLSWTWSCHATINQKSLAQLVTLCDAHGKIAHGARASPDEVGGSNAGTPLPARSHPLREPPSEKGTSSPQPSPPQVGGGEGDGTARAGS